MRSHSSEVKAERRTRAFFERYGRVISLIGALIVFATFIVKDLLSERWKDQASSLELAGYIFAILTDTSTIRNKVYDLSQDAGDKAKESIDQQHLAEVSSFITLLQRTGVLLGNLDLLVEKMPDNAKDKVKLKELQQRQQKYTQQALRTGDAVATVVNEKALHLEGHQADQARAAASFKDFEQNVIHGTLTLSGDFNEFYLAVLSKAPQVRQNIETKLWWAKLIAIVLYTTGSIIAGVGRW